jgi:hypothetical protein
MATGWAGAAQYGAPILSALLQSQGASDAASAQRDAANQATALQRDQFNQVRADAAPWRAAGENALAKLSGLLQDGSLTSKFAGMNPMEEAGYKFASREGQRAIDNSAAARGGIGGASLKAGARFAEDNANKFYNDAFNRFQTERTNTTNPLFQLAGFGPQANQQVAGAGQNYANQAGANSIFGGQAQAGNNIAQGNIYAGAVNQLASLYGRQQDSNGINQYGLPNYATDPYGP